MKFIPTYFYPRSGSTVVDRILNQHPDINAISEPFSSYRPLYREQIKSTVESDRPSFSLKNFMDPYILSNLNNKHKKTVCFQYYSFDISLFTKNYDDKKHIDFIKNNFKKFIVIRRRNLLKQTISWAKARKTKLWHNYTNNIKNIDTKIRLELDNCINYLKDEKICLSYNVNSLKEHLEKFSKSVSDTMTVIRQSGIDFLEIVYEDHIENDPLVAIRMIEQFLHIPHFKQYIIPLTKTSNGIKFDIENYDEIALELFGTQFEWMLK